MSGEKWDLKFSLFEFDVVAERRVAGCPVRRQEPTWPNYKSPVEYNSGRGRGKTGSKAAKRKGEREIGRASSVRNVGASSPLSTLLIPNSVG